MFKGLKKGAKEEEQPEDKVVENKDKKKSAEKSANPRSAGFLIILLLVVLFGGGGAGAVFFNINSLAAQLSASQSDAAFKLLQHELTLNINSQMDRVRQLAVDSGVRQSLVEYDEQKLAEVAELYAGQSPDILKIRFFKPGFLEIDDDAQAPVSYASIDLARRATEQKKIPPMEMHALSGKGKHIAVAAPILDEDKAVMGVVLVALSPFVINDEINSVDKKLFGVKLEQAVGEDVIELARSPAYKDNAQSRDIKLQNTIWRLQYQRLPVAVDVMQMWSVMALLLITLVIVILLIVLQKSFKKSLADDCELIKSYVEEKLKAKNTTIVPTLKLSETIALLKSLESYNLGKKGGAFIGKKIVRKKPEAAPEPAPAEAEKPAVPPSKDQEIQDRIASKTANHAQNAEVGSAHVFPSSVTRNSGEITAVESGIGEVDESIFREYDIRGVVGETLKPEYALAIGRAIGTFAVNKGETCIVVGRDGRISSNELASMLITGLEESGLNVTDIGLVPTPVLYFATHKLDCRSGVMVTGSHNPADYNGFKVKIAGATLSGAEIQQLYHLLQNEDDLVIGEGEVTKQDMLQRYVDTVVEDINLLSKPKIVVDCGHGAAGVVANKLFNSLGCDVTMLFDKVDGTFPDHHPDPGDKKNMQALIAAVKEQQADLGIAFDGDADRIGVVDSQGNIINPDRVLMLLAADLLMRNPGGDIIYDVKSSKSLASHILASGGNPVMWKSGHSLMKAKLKESGALLAGEFSGHIFYKERWFGFDDGLYVAARLLEILSGEGRASAEVFAQLPNPLSTPEIKLVVDEGQQHQVMAMIKEQALVLFGNAKVNDIDGIRAEYDNGWGLIRASNTTPSLTLRFEADDENAMEEIKQNFRSVIAMVLPDVTSPF